MVEWGHKKRSGLTLVEVMVALGLIAVSLMLILGMIPAGIQASQRAADIQAAAAWGRQLIEETPPPTTFPVRANFLPQPPATQIGSTVFSAKRTVKDTGPYLYRVEVEVTWPAAVEPVKLSMTRYNPSGPER